MVGIIISSILFELGHHHAMVCYALLCYLLLLPCYCLDGLTFTNMYHGRRGDARGVFVCFVFVVSSAA